MRALVCHAPKDLRLEEQPPGLIDGKPVISDIIAFDQSEDAFKLACDKSKSMKVQIVFDKKLSF